MILSIAVIFPNLLGGVLKLFIFTLLIPGHFCPNNTEFATQFPCNNGTYNNQTGGMNVNDCELCPPGMYCPYRGMPEPAGLCAEGWYCTLGAWKDQPTTLGNDTGKA